jgi:hypothetical protein
MLRLDHRMRETYRYHNVRLDTLFSEQPLRSMRTRSMFIASDNATMAACPYHMDRVDL